MLYNISKHAEGKPKLFCSMQRNLLAFTISSSTKFSILIYLLLFRSRKYVQCMKAMMLTRGVNFSNNKTVSLKAGIHVTTDGITFDFDESVKLRSKVLIENFVVPKLERGK